MSGYEFRGSVAPQDVIDALDAYAQRRQHPGGFLVAVLENDLRDAVGRADAASLAALPACVGYLYNRMPSGCHGSPAKVQAWLAGGAA